MAIKFFKKDVEPQCAFCEFGKTTDGGKTVVCRKIGGVMEGYSSCKKFKYDPFKREPKITTFSSDFTKEDFEI